MDKSPEEMAALSAMEVNAKHTNEKYSLEKHSDTESHDGLKIDHELDGIHDGLEFPTEEERATLRRVPDSIPWAAYREP